MPQIAHLVIALLLVWLPVALKALLLPAAGLGLALVVWLAGAGVAAAAFCAVYNNGTRSCGIPTQAMCVQSLSGVGGACELDQTDMIPPNFVQRMRARDNPPPPRRPLPPGAAGPFRPLDTSPCMSLSGDRCGNYLH
jgi:hypothetical protein